MDCGDILAPMEKIMPNFKIFLILIISSLAVLTLDIFHLLSLPKQAIAYVTNPIQLGIYDTHRKIGKQFFFIFQARFAAQENKALKEQIGKLLSENALLRKKLAETESLLSQEKHLDPATYNLLPARPIGKDRYLKIDKGVSSGVKIGQAVVSNDNYIGRIAQAGEKSSNILLLSDPDSKVAAFSQGLEGKAKGILVGQFGSEVRLSKILQEEKISAGDLVYSEGAEEFLPRGLVLGRVSQILSREHEIFKQAKVQLNFVFTDLELVFVIKD